MYHVRYISLGFKAFFSPLQYDSTSNSDPHMYFLNFPMAYLTVAVSTKKLCLEFYSRDTFDIEMKDIGCRHIPSRDLSNSHFPPYFYCASDLPASSETSTFRSTSPIPWLDQSFLMYNILERSDLAELVPDKTSFFNHSSSLYSSGFYRF